MAKAKSLQASHRIRYYDYQASKTKQADVCLLVDHHKLAQVLGIKAANNKTGRARAMKGAISCVLIKTFEG